MRARVVSLRDIHEKYKAEVKRFAPAFVIPRHIPGWDSVEGAEAGTFVYRTAQPSGRTVRRDGPSRPDPADAPPLRPAPPARPVAIDIKIP